MLTQLFLYSENSIFCWIVNILLENKVFSDGVVCAGFKTVF